jgi:hypothetical protein
MRVISTVHKEGFEQYGQKWVDGVANWPGNAEFHLYTEGFDLDNPAIKVTRVETLARAEAFKKQYAHYKPIAWRWDIVRFSNKVFAAYDALYNYKGVAVWLDADCNTFAKIPDGYIEAMLPDGKYLAAFSRIGWSTETGFWVMDCSHPRHKQFMDTWIRWFEAGSFKSLDQWCDASTLDATIRMFTKDDWIDVHSLSAGHEKIEHPMAKVDLAKYIDHVKGERKAMGFSVENKHVQGVSA